ncbi:MAG: hypothetical protein KGM99_20920 [Burkholderiales bacterium]|nr:hypothetical protein [Burkholderiales bacterium]
MNPPNSSNKAPSRLTIALQIVRCANVAAICSLAVWHGYAFHLQQAMARLPSSPVPAMELQLIRPAPIHHALTI